MPSLAFHDAISLHRSAASAPVTRSLLIVAAILALAWVVCVLVKMDSWRRIYVTMIFLLFCATSNVPQLVSFSYYPRFAAAAALAWWTWYHHRDEPAAGEPATAVKWLVS